MLFKTGQVAAVDGCGERERCHERPARGHDGDGHGAHALIVLLVLAGPSALTGFFEDLSEAVTIGAGTIRARDEVKGGDQLVAGVLRAESEQRPAQR